MSFPNTLKVELHGVGKRYDRKWVLRNLDWSIESGRVTSVIGLNGAGKTTLLYLLAGLYSPSEGEITVDGLGLNRELLEARREIFFMTDFPVVRADWTLAKLLAAFVILYGREMASAEDQLKELVAELDLEDVLRKPFTQMSRGQIYKSMLLCARVIAPQLWLLDEPFAGGMDSHGLSVMKRWFREAKEMGRKVVYTTQMPSIAAACADQILLLHEATGVFFHVKDGEVLGVDGASIDLEAHMEALRCSKPGA